jgi:uncharacterized protein YicC (UPF0701 family)
MRYLTESGVERDKTMTQIVEELKPQLARLCATDRAELAKYLLSSLDEKLDRVQAEVEAIGATLAELRRAPREERHARLRQLAAEAMADPQFVADVNDTMHAFRHIDAEGWPSYD